MRCRVGAVEGGREERGGEGGMVVELVGAIVVVQFDGAYERIGWEMCGVVQS